MVVSARPYRDLEIQTPVHQCGNDSHRRRFCQNTMILINNLVDDLAGMIYNLIQLRFITASLQMYYFPTILKLGKIRI